MQVRANGSNPRVEHYALQVRTPKIEGCLLKVLAVSMRDHIVHAEHYPPIFGHPGERPMLEKMCNELSRSQMTNDFFWTVRNRAVCRHNLQSLEKKRWLQLLPASRSIAFISMNVLCPLPRTKEGNTFHIVDTDRYSKV